MTHSWHWNPGSKSAAIALISGVIACWLNNWNILSRPNINNVEHKTGTGPGEGLPRIGKKTHVTSKHPLTMWSRLGCFSSCCPWPTSTCLPQPTTPFTEASFATTRIWSEKVKVIIRLYSFFMSRHPYKDQTVPIITALLIWLGLAVFFILLVKPIELTKKYVFGFLLFTKIFPRWKPYAR